MISIKDEVTSEIIINKSKFISILTPVNDLNEVNDKIKYIKNTYKNATHYCYGYIIYNHEKCSDDGEPSKTAGMPILNVLKSNNLMNVLCVVVRYFGGIKLGSGGLIRAYSSAASLALQKSKTGVLEEGYQIKISFNYDNIKNVDYILKEIEIDKTFDDLVYYKFNISKYSFDFIKDNLLKYCEILEKNEIKLIKEDN